MAEVIPFVVVLCAFVGISTGYMGVHLRKWAQRRRVASARYGGGFRPPLSRPAWFLRWLRGHDDEVCWSAHERNRQLKAMSGAMLDQAKARTVASGMRQHEHMDRLEAKVAAANAGDDAAAVELAGRLL